MTSKVRFKHANEASADFSFGMLTQDMAAMLRGSPGHMERLTAAAQAPADSQQQLSDVGVRVLKVTPAPATPDCDHLRDHEQELPFGAQSSPAP